MERIAADFGPLIKALQLASADPAATLGEQLAQVELSLVSAQINPDPYNALELRYALQALREIDPQGIQHARGTADLECFFATDPHLESF
jgi:hypothetical protein